MDVFPMIRENDYGRLSSSRPFVVVCPTYGWQIPHVLGNWLKKTRLSGSRKLYFCNDLRRRDRKCRRVCKTVL